MNQAHKRIQDAINNAPEFQDPLDALVERTAIDPTTPFAPEILERLRAMKAENFKSFELLRTELKKAGCRMGALDKAIDGNNDLRLLECPRTRPIFLSTWVTPRTCFIPRMGLASPILR